MARGRKRDLTLPTSRALAHQRAYRDRKATYVADLEERCRRAEAENARLRADLEIARGGHGANPAHTKYITDMAQASSELLQQLSAASTSIVRYQQLVSARAGQESLPRPDINIADPNIGHILSPLQTWPYSPLSPLHCPEAGKRPQSNPSEPTAPSFAIFPPSVSVHHSDASSSQAQPSKLNDENALASESECCSGIIDCDGIVNEEEPQTRQNIRAPTLSNLRSQQLLRGQAETPTGSLLPSAASSRFPDILPPQAQPARSDDENIMDSESECCGGIMNCEGLIEEEEPEACQDLRTPPISHMRSQQTLGQAETPIESSRGGG